MTDHTDHGGQYYPDGPVRIVFGDSADNEYIDLPNPSTRDLIWDKQVKHRETITGDEDFKDKGFKPQLELVWKKPSDTVQSKLIRLANYSDTVLIFPFFPGTVGQVYNGPALTLLMRLLKSETPSISGNNANTKFVFTFLATKLYSKQYDPDSLRLLHTGDVLHVTDPDGLPAGVYSFTVRPMTHIIGVTTPKRIVHAPNNIN